MSTRYKSKGASQRSKPTGSGNRMTGGTNVTLGRKRLLRAKAKQAHDKKEKFRIVIDGKDYTPKPLGVGQPGDTSEMGPVEELPPPVDAIFSGISQSGASIFVGGGGFHSKLSTLQSGMSPSNTVSISQMEESSIQELPEPLKSEVDAFRADKVPSQFLLPKFPYLEDPPFPDEVTIIMEETPTFFLMDRPSTTELDGTEEGRKAKRANERYEQRLEEAKAAFAKKKIVHMETQTPLRYRREERTQIGRCKRNNNSTNVTTYDIYVTYKLLKKTKQFVGSGNILEDPLKQQQIQVEGEPDGAPMEGFPVMSRRHRATSTTESLTMSMTMDSSFMDSTRPTALTLQSVTLPPSFRLEGSEEMNLEKEIERLFKRMSFQNAVFLVERILASNIFEEKQKIFKQITKEDEFRLELEFKYSLELLWTYVNDTVRGRTVTSLCWNRVNDNILAVGYGKYYYKDRKGGAVCCWCIKNPVQPERSYVFDAAVQSVDFSTSAPNLLAAGFYNGDVLVLDVSSRKLSVVARNNRETMTSFAPVWSTVWIRGDEVEPDDQLMTASQDGCIFRYKRSKTFLRFPMMRVTRSEGKQRGVTVPRKCDPHDIPITCHPPALALRIHPDEHSVYFVATGEGCVHKCSMDYLHHHLQMFVAHRGPVYSLRFSPFSNKFFLTCGADFCARMWADGVDEPLFALTVSGSRDPVMDVCWSTVNPTVIATVSSSNIYIWDIGRKIAAPVSTIKTPNEDPSIMKSRFTTISFTNMGNVLVAGDIRGNVHMFACKDMPFPPYFQEEALVSAIMNALATRPDLQKDLRRCYPLAEKLANRREIPLEPPKEET